MNHHPVGRGRSRSLARTAPGCRCGRSGRSPRDTGRRRRRPARRRCGRPGTRPPWPGGGARGAAPLGSRSVAAASSVLPLPKEHNQDFEKVDNQHSTMGKKTRKKNPANFQETEPPPKKRKKTRKVGRAGRAPQHGGRHVWLRQIGMTAVWRPPPSTWPIRNDPGMAHVAYAHGQTHPPPREDLLWGGGQFWEPKKCWQLLVPRMEETPASGGAPPPPPCPRSKS